MKQALTLNQLNEVRSVERDYLTMILKLGRVDSIGYPLVTIGHLLQFLVDHKFNIEKVMFYEEQEPIDTLWNEAKRILSKLGTGK